MSKWTLCSTHNSGRTIATEPRDVFRAIGEGQLFINCNADHDSLKVDFRVGGKKQNFRGHIGVIHCMGYPKIGKGRTEAFSDGVLAIIITIMVLELKVPHGESLETLRALIPTFLSYLLSFVYIAIYWNNHQGKDDVLKKAIGDDWKGKLSPLIYVAAIVVGHWSSTLAMVLYTTVALIWIIPDPRIEKMYHA